MVAARRSGRQMREVSVDSVAKAYKALRRDAEGLPMLPFKVCGGFWWYLLLSVARSSGCWWLLVGVLRGKWTDVYLSPLPHPQHTHSVQSMTIIYWLPPS